MFSAKFGFTPDRSHIIMLVERIKERQRKMIQIEEAKDKKKSTNPK